MFDMLLTVDKEITEYLKGKQNEYKTTLMSVYKAIIDNLRGGCYVSYSLSITPHINCIVAHCLINVVCYQVMMTFALF